MLSCVCPVISEPGGMGFQPVEVRFIVMESMGRMLLLFGGILVVLGLVLTFVGKIPWIGRLPGDIRIEKENFSFYFPIATCIILSIILTLIFNLFGGKR